MPFNYKPTLSSATPSRIDAIQKSGGIQFSLGSNLENYDYRSPIEENFSTLIHQRLKQLRQKYDYIRLWFSGGKDSRLVLDHAIKHGIKIDEIFIVRHCPAGNVPIGGQVETDGNAIKYLQKISYQGKVTVVNLDPDHYDSVFSDPDWPFYTNIFTIHAPIYVQMFQKYVDPKFGYFHGTPANQINIVGCIQPHIWYDNGWKFCFVDYQLTHGLAENTESFLISDDFPEILHGYVFNIKSKLEELKIFPKQFQENILSNIHGNQHLRSIRDLLDEFADIRLPRPDLEMPKCILDPWRPSDDYFWEMNKIYKTFISCWLCYNQDPWPEFFKKYVYQTNWEMVKKSQQHPGILSKIFDFSE